MISTALSGCGLIRLGIHDPPPTRQIVVHVGVDGAANLDVAGLTSGLSTHSDNFGSFESKPLYNPLEARRDEDRLESAYAARGYFEARCVGHRLEPVDDVSVRVFFEIQEGQPTRVTSRHVSGLAPSQGAGPETIARLAATRAEAHDLLRLKIGDVWSSAGYDAGKAAIRARLVTRGFVYAEVVGTVQINRVQRTAGVIYEVVPGPLATFAGVKVQGQSVVSKNRILRRVDVKLGSVADPDVLLRIQRQVAALGMFYAVSVRVKRRPLDAALGDRPATAENLRSLKWNPKVVVVVTVQERKVNEVRTGLGLSVDNERSDIHALAGYTNRNLFGGLRQLSLTAQPAYYALPSAFDIQEHGPGIETELSFRQPSFLEEYLTLDLTTSYDLGVEEAYRLHDAAGRVAFSRSFAQRLTLYLAYSVNFQDLFRVQSGTNLADVGLEDNFFLTYLEFGLTVDFRDDLLNPRRGGYAGASFKASLPALGSAFEYLQGALDLRGYWTPTPWLTLALRGAWWHSFPLADDPPITEWYQGGGASDMRGYASQTMGP
ncbi:MAG: outer membrane protein assembly factor BamA, partial [Myxococcota bacterium]